MINLVHHLNYIEVKNAAYKFMKDMLKEEKYCYNILKNYVNKKLVITEKKKKVLRMKNLVIFVIKNMIRIIKIKLKIMMLILVSIKVVLMMSVCILLTLKESVN